MYLLKFHRADNRNPFYIPHNNVESFSIAKDGSVTITVGGRSIEVLEDINSIKNKYVIAGTCPCLRPFVKWLMNKCGRCL